MDSKIKVFGHPVHQTLIVLPLGLFAAAVVFDIIDWLAIPKGTRAKSIGALHGIGNVTVVLLFIGSWAFRRDAPQDPTTAAFVLSLAGAALSVVTGWLGGELVDRLGVGVHDGAHLDAPSSLSKHSLR